MTCFYIGQVYVMSKHRMEFLRLELEAFFSFSFFGLNTLKFQIRKLKW
jgi:hypothetical protein